MSLQDDYQLLEGRGFKKECKKLRKKHAGLDKDLAPVLTILKKGSDMVLSPTPIQECRLGLVKKARIAMISERKGKSNGYRLYYVRNEEKKTAYLLLIYTHQQQDNVSDAQLREILADFD